MREYLDNFDYIDALIQDLQSRRSSAGRKNVDVEHLGEDSITDMQQAVNLPYVGSTPSLPDPFDSRDR